MGPCNRTVVKAIMVLAIGINADDVTSEFTYTTYIRDVTIDKFHFNNFIYNRERGISFFHRYRYITRVKLVNIHIDRINIAYYI